jgi:uncharacterized ion transporter superfamily protein YfcC
MTWTKESHQAMTAIGLFVASLLSAILSYAVTAGVYESKLADKEMELQRIDDKWEQACVNLGYGEWLVHQKNPVPYFSWKDPSEVAEEYLAKRQQK